MYTLPPQDPVHCFRYEVNDAGQCYFHIHNPAPPKSFKVDKKLHLDVKITTENETADDAPVISLHVPVKTEKTVSAPPPGKAVRKAAQKNFRPAKTQKLRVKVSSAVRAEDAPEKKTPRKNGAAPAKKGK